MKWACGLDPGLSGAIVLLSQDHKKVMFWPMPLTINGKQKEIDYPQVSEILRNADSVAEGNMHAFLERAVPFAMGTKSAFNYGRGFAALEIALSDLDIPHSMVEPAKWTKAMHVGIKGDLKPKAKSAIAVKRLFPKLTVKLPKSKKGALLDGFVDALLIAGFGLRTMVERESPAIADF